MERSSGILLPLFSLPSPYGIGTMGLAAYDFADLLHAAGQRYWQMLPLGPTSYGDSPYQSFSSYAGNPYLIDLDLLIEDGLLTEQEVRDRMSEAMKACIERQRTAISENIDMDAFYLLDNEFHGCLLEAVGKKDVMEIIREDYIHFRRWRNFYVVRSGRQREIIEEHTALMHALVKNETKEAHEILHMHLNTENRLRHIREKVSPEYFIYH